MTTTTESTFDDVNAEFGLTVRAYNILKREGVSTAVEFAELHRTRLWEMRGMAPITYEEIRHIQDIIRERLEIERTVDEDDLIRTALIQFLLDEGLAEAHYGFGHATADQVADKLLDTFTITRKASA